MLKESAGGDSQVQNGNALSSAPLPRKKSCEALAHVSDLALNHNCMEHVTPQAYAVHTLCECGCSRLHLDGELWLRGIGVNRSIEQPIGGGWGGETSASCESARSQLPADGLA